MRLHRHLIAVASRIVPFGQRREWRAEWDAEIASRERGGDGWRAGRGSRMALVRSAGGAFADAFCLRAGHWHSLRFLARHWRLSLAAIGSLAVATAAVVAGFSLTNAMLFRPPGVTDPDRLLSIHVGTAASPYGAVSFPEFAAYRSGNHVFSDVTAFPQSIADIELDAGQGAQRVLAAHVAGNYFAVLGVAATRGDLRLPDTGDANQDRVAISTRLWQRLGSPPNVAGASIRLNSRPMTVAGVVPPTFGRMMLVWEPDVWFSLKAAEQIIGAAPSELTDRGTRSLHMVGRLRPDVTEAQAAADVRLLAARFAADDSSNAGRSAVVTPTTTVPPSDRRWASQLAGALVAVTLLLFVAAASNVASLLLGLSMERQHEMAVRAALGASRLQLAVPALREAVTLAVCGGAAGYVVAHAALLKLSSLRPPVGPPGFPRPSFDVHPDVRVALVTSAIVLAAGVAIGAAPAWDALSNGDPLRIGWERQAGSRRARRGRSALVVAQMATATMVLVGVGVALRSLVNLERSPLGFSARNVAFWGVSWGPPNTPGPELYDRIRLRVAAIPGVEAVTLADSVPLFGTTARERVLADGESPGADGRGVETPYTVVDRAFFDTLQFARIAGRTFDIHDRADTAEVAVVNETFARAHWPGANAVGRRIRLERGSRDVEIVGVVADTKLEDLAEAPRALIYLSLEQQRSTAALIAIARAGVSAGALLAPVQTALHEFDPGNTAPPWLSGTLDDLLALSLFLPRTIAATIGALGLTTLAVAVVGLYGTVFYSIGQRKREIGIRLTLGASPRDVFRLVLRYAAALSLAGSALGIVCGGALVPVIAGIFYRTDGVQGSVLVAAAGMVAALTIAIAYVAARPWMRASPIDIVRA
jgi:predicted permease